ncbi:TPA: type VI secretion-associated lipoprotein TagQ [Pseudomonas aeruginosa]|nr:type VI secretion-associated lipoprotein TagQ [Pseudomonas aeruginosa]
MSQPSENRLITSARYALCLLTASGVLLSGCASSGVGSVAQTTRAEYYPSCYEPVSHLRSTDNAVRNSAITGAITGGLLGALAGGAAGYYMEKQKQISDDRARIGSYATDVDRSTVEINRSVAYAKSAQSCYQSQFKALLDGRKNKSINEAEGRKRLAEIVSGLQETNALLVAANGRAGENINNYTQAYEKDLQQVGVPRTEVTKVAEAENRASTTKGGSKPKTGSNPKVPKEAVATEQTIRKAQDAQSEGNKVASRGQGMIQEVCNSPDMGDWAPPSCAKA